MDNFDTLNIIYYCVFAAFVYYQQLHLKEFNGASKIFEIILSVFSFAGMIVGFAYLIYYGFKATWWSPFVVFAIGLVFMFIAVFIEKIVGKFTLSLIGFIVWPISAYYMFKSIPIIEG